VRHRTAIAAVAAAGLAWTSLGAAEFWDTKAFNTWSDAEVKKVLTSSPWAGKAGISYVVSKGASMPTIDEAAVAVWNSALPVRQAYVREQIGAVKDVPKDASDLLAQAPAMYVVSVKISGTPNSAGYARQAAAAQKETFLLRDGKPPIAAVQSEGRMLDKDGKVVEMPATPGPGGIGAPRGGAPAGAPGFAIAQGGRGGGARGGGGRGGGGFGGGPRDGSGVLVFAFPRTDAITAADREVEFATRVGQFNVKRKFKLSEMMFKGELAI
jgi:hypothetical protein